MEKKSVFTRNPEVEELAQEKLHYSVEEVKRRTIAQLQKELNGLRKSNVSDKSPGSGLKTPPHRHIGGAYIRTLKKLYEQKRAMFSLLEEDSDFDDEDLQDWEESLQRLKNEIQTYSKRYEHALVEKWERKREKLKQLEDEGLLDEIIGEKWAKKHEGACRPLKPPSNRGNDTPPL